MGKLIERINYLAAKKKREGLTPVEVIEQRELREEYLKIFRTNMKKQLDNIEIEK